LQEQSSWKSAAVKFKLNTVNILLIKYECIKSEPNQGYNHLRNYNINTWKIRCLHKTAYLSTKERSNTFDCAYARKKII
jgi:hypothetical protein